ncbi:bifunctional diaminohydroxyphosphoribosylaminopyrimidine deaminase/5-amino-6-(5-phosphoribosylamino)uracil reductase RibD [Arenimonas sp. GDDSR-1]|uniref:bifunctional diaminohydroxyphosphoribosylaminopyrimidine deaminase/5-amino-6-(5-phosphoribosylamino)uracil reductase RibD n=1 Tax=Arenimonas sp. GDDSR-1 TaxID=2950125 RepID=UPI00262FB77A|nr:bifunctional diaminohydroxyphosphoribosylaminopyrimidine deaminase/5-amino-6-(5-phosphoribosylamino)uracil reductase RibD [Arenimonas sp. GDDSR-1]
MDHAGYMGRALELARQARGRTWPNPMVGCVIVKDGRVLAEGFHAEAGQAHAEADALARASEPVDGATLYVNLEPCCHTRKRTPPCAQALIRAGIARVVIANIDPNPAVSGGGIALLREAGIEVITDILAEDGERLNEVFFHRQRSGLPFVHLKLASTLDGRIAMPDGQSQWITGEAARAHAHQLRAEHSAIAVGAGTLRTDNPRLTVRLPGFDRQQPQRIIFSRSGKLPADAHVFTDADAARTRVFAGTPLPETLAMLAEDGICNLLLEGGAGLAAAFLQAGLVQRVSHYLNPSYLGEGLPALSGYGLTELRHRLHLKHVEYSPLGDDMVLTGRL